MDFDITVLFPNKLQNLFYYYWINSLFSSLNRKKIFSTSYNSLSLHLSALNNLPNLFSNFSPGPDFVYFKLSSTSNFNFVILAIKG